MLVEPSALVCTVLKCECDEVLRFKHRLVCLLSMMHVAALADIEDWSTECTKHVAEVLLWVSLRLP